VRPGLRTVFSVCSVFSVIVAGILVAAVGGVLRATGGAPSANRVLGQIDFSKHQVNFVDAVGMNAPAGVAIDKANGHMIVADSQNNRVMGWKSVAAFSAGGAADLVIGQPDFNSSGCNQNAPAPDATTLCRPIGVAFDVAHRVYVGDTQNNRVLVYEDPFEQLGDIGKSSDFQAVVVFGQAGSLTTSVANESGLSADSLFSPQGVAIDASGNLFIADVNNNRVLVFFSPLPMTAVKGVPGSFGDATADVAIGQPDLVSGACNQGGTATPATLCIAPFFGVGVAVDGGDNLYVADTENDRALEYNGPFGFGQTNNLNPDLVFAGNSIARPSGVAADSNQNFYVSSEAHNQVYEYTQPVPLMRSDLLNLKIGPGAQNPNAASLQFPMGIAIDGSNNLYVADQANNRVLEYNEFGSPGNKTANGAGGQIDAAHNGANLVDAIGENTPGGIAVDATSQSAHRHVYVADTVNNRVIGWKDVASFVAAEPADIVLGQPDLFSNKCNNGRAAGDVGGLGEDSLCGPARMAVDPAGNLYVADAGNNRVLVYNTPFNAASGEPGAGDASADFVYGQGGAFTTRTCNPSGANATTLCNPSSATIDGAGNVYIADAGNSRVLEFAKAGNPPVASDAIASRSYGQGAIGDFSDTACANGVDGNPAASNHAMCNPGGVALDASGDLFVADTGNDRVIEIDAPLAGTQNASRVFGQAGDFTASSCNRGAMAPTASTLCAPAGLMIDILGNLWVADANNDRVLEYKAPFDADTAAAMAIGQGDSGNFTTAGCDTGIAPGDLFGIGADSLCAPAAVALDANIDLYVADAQNNRSMIFDGIIATPTPSATATATATGTASPTASATVTATATATATATSTATATLTPTSTPTPARGGKLKLRPKSIKFGNVAVGSRSKVRAIKIRNAGTVTMAAAVPTLGAPFVVSGGEFIVGPHGAMAVAIEFAPTVKGPAHGVLVIQSSDPKHLSVKVKFSGIGK
jgi:NHL repeat